MQARRARRAMGVVALATALLAAGCSDDGDDGSSSEKTTTTKGVKVDGPTTTTPADEFPTTTEGDATTTTDGGGSTTTTAYDGVEDNGGDPGKEGTETGDLDTLASGTHYGYAAGLEDGEVEGHEVQVLLWDEVQFLTGKDAADAAKDRGDEVNNDYYIVNDNQKVRRLAVVPDAQVYSLKDGGTTDTVPASVNEISKQPYLFRIVTQNVRGKTTITYIEAVFLP